MKYYCNALACVSKASTILETLDQRDILGHKETVEEVQDMVLAAMDQINRAKYLLLQYHPRAETYRKKSCYRSVTEPGQ